jgi:hypothetical protein
VSAAQIDMRITDGTIAARVGDTVLLLTDKHDDLAEYPELTDLEKKVLEVRLREWADRLAKKNTRRPTYAQG